MKHLIRLVTSITSFVVALAAMLALSAPAHAYTDPRPETGGGSAGTPDLLQAPVATTSPQAWMVAVVALVVLAIVAGLVLAAQRLARQRRKAPAPAMST